MEVASSARKFYLSSCTPRRGGQSRPASIMYHIAGKANNALRTVFCHLRWPKFLPSKINNLEVLQPQGNYDAWPELRAVNSHLLFLPISQMCLDGRQVPSSQGFSTSDSDETKQNLSARLKSASKHELDFSQLLQGGAAPLTSPHDAWPKAVNSHLPWIDGYEGRCL